MCGVFFVWSDNFPFWSDIVRCLTVILRPENYQFQYVLYLRNCRSYHQDFDYDIYRCFSLFLKKKFNIVNSKITLFFIGPLQKIFKYFFFFKFINKYQKEILRCAPPSSHVCDFFVFYMKFVFTLVIFTLNVI